MAVILAARRGPVAPRGGALKHLAPHDLAAPVIRAALSDAGIARDAVGEVVLSNAIGPGGNVARICALAAGLPERVAGLSIDRQCAGGLDAVLLAAALVDAGAHEVVVAGGVESCSRRPLRLAIDPEGGAPVPYDQAPFTPWPDRDPDMAEAADRLGRDLGIDRAAQEAWARKSHAAALAAGPDPAIVPLAGLDRDPFARDLTPRLCARAPVVAGAVTAATMAVAADGAAALVVVSDAVAAGRGWRVAGCTRGGDPERPGLAPVAAIRAALAAGGLAPEDVVAAEVMEAFAVQAIACVDGAGLPRGIVNARGGALARGHPIGASGAVLAVELIRRLEAVPGPGLAAIASAGGIGTALVLRPV